jgi:GNAT superfamily N-acetyltransferase
MPSSPLCRLLEWDSQFFGRRIGRVCTERIGPAEVERIRQWSDAEGVECLYYLASAADAGSVRTAEEAGFRLTDIRMTRVRELGDGFGATPEGVEPFRSEDVPALRAIARVGHRDSRFYFDGNFPRDRCDALYETWIEKSCTGGADAVLVVRDAAGVAGYMAVKLNADETGTLDLMAVAPERRRGGLGHRVVQGSLVWLADHGCRHFRVVTQGRNVGSARIFEDFGFRTSTVEHFYHFWLPHSSPGARPKAG